MKEQRPDRIVTIARFWHVADADLARTVLATRGITAFLADVNTRTLAPHLAQSVRLQVLQSDARRAIEILNENADHHPQLKAGVPRLPRCPECGSYDVAPRRLGRLLVLAIALLLLIPLLFMKREWRCRACGHRWRT